MASLSDLRAEEVFETTRQPLVILDGDLRVVAANHAFHGTFGLDRRDVLGARLYDIGQGVWNVPRLRALLEEVLPRQAELRGFEIDDIFGAAGRRAVLLNARELRRPAGEDRLILLAIEDVTARRASDAAALRATEELKRSNRELQEFASVASHDLQEPLRKIQAFGDLLQRHLGSRLDATAADYIARMRGGAERMSRLINDLLTYARLGSMHVALEPLRLEDVIREVISDREARIAAAGARVGIGPLPELHADRGQMRQLFGNLIGNALKFAREGMPLQLRIEGTPIGAGQWEIIVSDNGIGFDQQYAERIFGMFQRLHGRTLEGTGIGLALCRRIAERHGGSIRAEGDTMRGARFIVTLPLVPPASKDGSP